MLCLSVFPRGLRQSWARGLTPIWGRCFGKMPGSGARVGGCWEQLLQVKSVINKQIVGTHARRRESTTLGRRGSGRALNGLLLLGCRCPRRFLGNSVSPHAWGGVSPSRTVPGFSRFALLWPQPWLSTDADSRAPAQSYFFPPGLCLHCAPGLMCPFSSLAPRLLAYLLATLKSLSSGLPSLKNPSMTHTPTHTHPWENEVSLLQAYLC